MADEQRREFAPLFFRQCLHQIQLDPLGIWVTAQTETLRDSDDMRIDGNSFVLAKARPQDDRRGLAPDTLERRELLHRLRDLALMMLDELLAHFLDETSFVAVRSAGVDVVFQLFS